MESILGDKGKNLMERSFTAHSALMPAGTEVPSPATSPSLADNVASAIKKTQSYYLGQQHEDGYWWSELESNVTITAEYLMLLHFLGLKDRKRDRKITSHILKNQRSDGTWSIHWGGEGDLSTTIEAYFALKLAGHSEDEPCLVKAREFILQKGGVENSRVLPKYSWPFSANMTGGEFRRFRWS